jgi:hypothetical protein
MRGSAPQYGQQDVDEQVSAAAGDEEDAHRGDCVALVAGGVVCVRRSRAGARKRVTMMRRIVLSMVAVVVVDVDVDVDVDDDV